jgi:exopolysaccharide production protein ExoQ
MYRNRNRLSRLSGRDNAPSPPAYAAQPPARDGSSIAVTVAIWVLILLMILPEGLVYEAPTTGLGVLPTEGSPLTRTLWLALLAFSASVTLSRSGAALKLLRQINPFLFVFIGLVACSALWSIEPEITLRRLLRVITILLTAMALAVTSSQTHRFQSVLRPLLTTLLVVSIIFVIAAPEMAIMQSDQPELVGAWHGITTQKNALGSLAAISLILWVHAWLSRESRSSVVLFGAAVSATCLINSRSSSSLMATAFSIVLMLMLLRSPTSLRRYLPYLIGLFAATLLIYSLAVLNLVPGSGTLLSPITMITGKDQTFSGRTAVWAILNEHIAYRPWLGSGFGAYWVQLPTSPSMEMMQRLYFYPTEGHNGYLDVINDLGIVGGFCLLAYLVTFLRQGLRVFAGLRPQGALYLTLLFEQLVGNLSESRWFNVLAFDFVIMTMVTVSMAKTLIDQRLQNRPAAPYRSKRMGTRPLAAR